MPDEPVVDEGTQIAEDEIDLEDLIGRVLETRGYTLDRASKLDLLDSLGESIGAKIDEVFSKLPVPSGGNEPAVAQTVDTEGLLVKVGEMIDAKLGAITPSGGGEKERKAPMMQRLLGVKA